VSLPERIAAAQYANAVTAEIVAEVTRALERERIQLEVWCGAELEHEMVGRLGQAELESVA
jgi:hypothetical protein